MSTTSGYVSDVLADAAIEFITRNRDGRFFAYLAFNAPHTPLQVPPGKYAKYEAMNLAVALTPERRAENQARGIGRR